jgi:hypothetical protein
MPCPPPPPRLVTYPPQQHVDCHLPFIGLTRLSSCPGNAAPDDPRPPPRHRRGTPTAALPPRHLSTARAIASWKLRTVQTNNVKPINDWRESITPTSPVLRWSHRSFEVARGFLLRRRMQVSARHFAVGAINQGLPPLRRVDDDDARDPTRALRRSASLS